MVVVGVDAAMVSRRCGGGKTAQGGGGGVYGGWKRVYWLEQGLYFREEFFSGNFTRRSTKLIILWQWQLFLSSVGWLEEVDLRGHILAPILF